MKSETFNELIGKHISVIVKGLPHPTSGILEDVGESYIVINPNSTKVEKIIIEVSEIASLLVGKNEVNDYAEQKNTRRS